MESNAVTPLFGAAGYDMGAYLVTSGILSTAWEESEKAYQSDKEQFIVQPKENLVIIAFPGTSSTEDFITDSKFRQCSINEGNGDFESLRPITTDDEPDLLVHSGFLTRFLCILKTSKIKEEVEEAHKEKKKIVFTGHSLGGALATLAAIWVLEKRQKSNPPLCVTFGCPLVGDEMLAGAIRRKAWVVHFYHVVSRNDIVPRILLAPFESVSQPLRALLPYWSKSMQKKGKLSDDKKPPPPRFEERTGSLLTTVRKHALAVASTITTTFVVGTNLLLGSINSTYSPYRPFGCFVFCSTSGAVCIENYATVLQMLYHTLQSPDTPNLPKDACITEHTEYCATIDEIAKHLLNAGGAASLAISDAKSAYEVGIAMQLEALGVGVANVQARLALQTGGEAESRRNINSARKAGELGDAQAAMAKIEWYKKCCAAEGLGYYDSFKQYAKEKDLEANLARLKLAAFWDEVIEMVSRQELPDGFESQNKWVNAGTAYRRLVEPLDIANYYRLGKDEDTGGDYLSKGRPRRYRILERWLKQKERTRSIERRTRPASLTTDSLFWGHLEKLLHTEEKEPTSDNATLERLKFQGLVSTLLKNNELSDDVVLPRSSFLKRWKETQPHPLEIDLSPFGLTRG